MSLFQRLAKELYDYEECAHSWVYQKEEKENLDGHIVTQYYGGNYCFKCETWEDE
tara:strand:+ start:886 stop:1050 length:165 start_codon:yes stop_codon:yes gene_type:complete